MDTSNVTNTSIYGNINCKNIEKMYTIADSIHDELSFLQNSFTIISKSNFDVTFPPHFFSGLSNIIEDMSTRVEDIIDYMESLKREKRH